jgi:predicted nucleic acid-binding protein
MTDAIGVDTDWLVQLAMADHPNHDRARRFWDVRVAAGTQMALAPQVMAELVHLITDGRRFGTPSTIPEEALEFASRMWLAVGIVQVFPTVASFALAWEWMTKYQLGRKRVLDTQLAATLHSHGISKILTLNPRDYSVFGVFEMMETSEDSELKG